MNEKTGLSRRAFVASVAAGAAVLASGGSARAAAKTTAKKAVARKGAGVAAAPSAAVRAEIAKQKKQTADLVKTLREFTLPPASGEVAFVFHPMRPVRATRSGGDK